MNVTYLDGSEAGIRELALAAFPSYKGRKFSFEITSEVQPMPTYWDGGTRYQYAAVQISTRRAVVGQSFAPPGFGGPGMVRPIQLVPDVLVVEHCVFCGQDAGLTFHVHPSDAPKMLPPAPDVTGDMRIVCEYSAALKASYGGVKDLRFVEASRETGITREQWDTARAACIAAKLLNKAGAITPAGRNVRLK